MARQEFLFNLRMATGFLSPTVQANGIRLDEEHLTDVLRRSTIWLTSRAVEGFDPADFPEIPKSELEQLARDVRKFKTIAANVPGDRPATEAQVRDATPVFLTILSAMWPYLEGFKVYAALRRQRFPGFVGDFAVKIGEDSTGDPSTWIWVIVEDKVVKEKKLISQVPEIRKLVGEALDRADIELYPYILFRTRSEQLELESVPPR